MTTKPPNQTSLTAAILIISQTASQDPTTDKGIPALTKVFLDDRGKTATPSSGSSSPAWTVAHTQIVPDDVLAIQRCVTAWTDGGAERERVDLVVTSGGTGFAVQDVTPEAVAPLLHKQAPGLVHSMLSSSLNITPFAAMARPVAGVRNGSLIITLPGSPKGATENLQAILPLLPHACQQARGANSRTLHQGGVKALEQAAGVAGAATPSTSSPVLGHDHAHSYSHSHGHAHHHHNHDHGHPIPNARTAPSDRPSTSTTALLSNDPTAGPVRRHRESPYPMISVPAALALIATHTPAPAVVSAPVGPALVGSVLAADVTAAEDVPAFRASIVDGYAIVAADHVLVPSTKGVFPVVGVSHAQATSGRGDEGGAADNDDDDTTRLMSGEVARITTGAPLPPGATAVVMVEDTVVRARTADGREEREIEILTDATRPGENVREVGSDVARGTVVLRRGEGITAVGGELGLLASVGVREVQVFRRPVVGVLSTGDEIVPFEERPGGLRRGEVRDTNRPTLVTAVRGMGFEAVDLGIASDKPGALESTLRAALRGNIDVLLTTGGVSMGELDLLKPTIERALGGTIHFGRVAMKPGKPTTFASIPTSTFKQLPTTNTTTTTTTTSPPETDESAARKKLIFALPGNPASAIVTFHLFVLPALHQMSGVAPPGLARVPVVLAHDFRRDARRTEYHRAVVTVDPRDGRLVATSTGENQRSSRVGSFKGANALVCLPPVEKEDGEGAAGDGGDGQWMRKGEMAQALLMGPVGAAAAE